MEFVDSHQHFWALERGGYTWLSPDLGVLYADYGPDDLAPQLADAKIDKTVLVQAAPTLDETRYLLSLAEQHSFIAGVVGWVDMASSSVTKDISALAKHPKLKGVRPMIQEIPDPNWVLNDQLTPAFEALIEHGLRFDALVQTKHLDIIVTLMKRHPQLRLVIDHAAKPDIASREFNLWARKISTVAQETTAYCKLSGLITEADAADGISEIAPYFNHIYREFGANRLMWGSDWPVVRLRAEYAGWQRMTHNLLAGVPTQDRKEIYGLSAKRFYNLR